MSGIINKVKEALHSDNSTTHNTTSGAPEGTHGPHGSRIANAADPRVDSDRDGSHNVGRTAGHNEYGSSTGGYAQGTGVGANTGSTGLGHSSGTREGEHGPHGSRIANAVDPRVDSDRDGSRNAGASYGTGHTTGTTGLGHSSGTREGEHGPHGSRAANALDPRVDSDRDGSRNAGAAYGSGTHTGTTGTGFGSTTGSSGLGHSSGTREGEHGPHGSRAANALDPRVDSDRDGSRNVGASYGTGHSTTGTSGFGSSTTGHHADTGVTGTHGAPTGAYGDHNSRLANAADPRIDSDRDGRGAVGHNAPGPAPNTAGPHKSDMLNKLDPRVDSDLDHSKTVGGNKTYQ